MVREKLANVYEVEGDIKSACEHLMAIPIDSTARMIENEYKAIIDIRIATLSLQAGDHAQASKYINRASAVVYKCSKPALIIQQYKVNAVSSVV